ncbi:Lrp/AsnC family transcriptional regulator [Azospirillum sp.]|uniref:Lrp/AsnC family transcriptional regulator n=1 Tax=Azospirillum sp. TaxID=34012 RepID=UPI002D3CE7D9|nr:Lrp/AsnC family transcriptional regulator [Azospirillum sp.]HYF88494.1 Lrp/AsnC family transcriptional regulator [Azospirillum sp.]
MRSTTARPPDQLDDQDRAILRILQRDNKTSQRAIGEAVNLSAPAVQRRIARMEAAGIIRRNIAVVDPASVGQGVTVVVEVQTVNDRSPVIAAAKRLFREAPEVQQCYLVTGKASFILILLVPDMASYEVLSRRLFADNELVQAFQTLVVLDPVKVTLEVDV